MSRRDSVARRTHCKGCAGRWRVRAAALALVSVTAIALVVLASSLRATPGLRRTGHAAALPGLAVGTESFFTKVRDGYRYVRNRATRNTVRPLHEHEQEILDEHDKQQHVLGSMLSENQGPALQRVDVGGQWHGIPQNVEDIDDGSENEDDDDVDDDDDDEKPFSTTYIPGSNNVSIKARQRLLAKFAPKLLLHPRDRWRPADPRVIFNVSRHSNPADPSNSHISIPRDYAHGNNVNISTAKVSAPVSAQVVQEGPGKRTYIQYWFFYPVNGCQGFRIGLWTGLNSFVDERSQNFEWCGMAFHNGDWEHITIKLNRRWDGTMEDVDNEHDPLEVEWVAFSQHAEAQWVKARKLSFADGTHVVAYAGMNSHANYPYSGTHKNADDTFDFVSRIAPILSFGSVQWIQIADVADIMNDLFLYDEPGDGNAQRFISWETWTEPVLDMTDRVVINYPDDDHGDFDPRNPASPLPPRYAGAELWALYDGFWGDEYDQTLIVKPPVGVQAGSQLHAATLTAARLGILDKFVRKHEMAPKGPRSHRVYYTLDYPPIL